MTGWATEVAAALINPICAERSAVSRAVTQFGPEIHIEAIAVANLNGASLYLRGGQQFLVAADGLGELTRRAGEHHAGPAPVTHGGHSAGAEHLAADVVPVGSLETGLGGADRTVVETHHYDGGVEQSRGGDDRVGDDRDLQDSAWRLEFFLQSTEDPSLLVPAEQITNSK